MAAGRENTNQRGDIHPAFANRRQRTRNKKQGVAGQEGRHDKARFGKDDEKQNAVNPQAVLLHHQRQMFVEMKDDIEELRQKFHVGAPGCGKTQFYPKV